MMKLYLKYYFIRVFLVNILALVYLSDTYSFDFGFISIQSLIYSIHVYSLYFFVFFETVSAFISQYGLDFHFYKLIFSNFLTLNYTYVGYVFYENISIIYYLVFTTLIIFYLEKKKYEIVFKFKSYNINQKFYLFSFILAFILSIINPSLSHQSLIKRIKGATNMWTEVDKTFVYEVEHYNQMVKNHLFRNENWFITLNYSFIYSANLPAGSRELANIDDYKYFGNFEKIITQKKFNNIYVIINESYPNFRNQDLKNNLFQKIVLNNESLNIKESKVSSNKLGQLISRIEDGTISGKIAKDIFEKIWTTGKEVDDIIKEEGLEQVTDDKEIELMIDVVIENNPQQLEQYRSGKDRLFGFFVGQVMKASQGKANPKQVNDILKSKLEK